MSNSLLNAVWDLKGERGAGAKSRRLILLALADLAREGEGDTAYPGVEELSKRTLCSKSTVLRSLRDLVRADLITIQHRKNPKERRGNEYWLNRTVLLSSGRSQSVMVTPQIEQSTGVRMTPHQPVTSVKTNTSQVSNRTFSGVKTDTPPAPPYRKNHKEPKYEPEPSAVEEAISRIAEVSRELQTEATREGIGKAITAALRKGTSLEELERNLGTRWNRYAKARDQGKFEIRGWGAPKFFAEGHWRDEQAWPWRPEHRPSPPPKYLDLQARLNGSDYQRPAQLGVAS